MGIFTLGPAGGIFTIGDAGGTVTLRYSGGIGTLGGGGGTVRTAGFAGTILGSAVLAMAFSNILARSTMASCWAPQEWENGAAGAELVRASVRARAATMAASTEDVLGTGHWCGENCTVLEVHLDLVFGTYSW